MDDHLDVARIQHESGGLLEGRDRDHATVLKEAGWKDNRLPEPPPIGKRTIDDWPRLPQAKRGNPLTIAIAIALVIATKRSVRLAIAIVIALGQALATIGHACDVANDAGPRGQLPHSQ